MIATGAGEKKRMMWKYMLRGREGPPTAQGLRGVRAGLPVQGQGGAAARCCKDSGEQDGPKGCGEAARAPAARGIPRTAASAALALPCPQGWGAGPAEWPHAQGDTARTSGSALVWVCDQIAQVKSF